LFVPASGLERLPSLPLPLLPEAKPAMVPFDLRRRSANDLAREFVEEAPEVEEEAIPSPPSAASPEEGPFTAIIGPASGR